MTPLRLAACAILIAALSVSACSGRSAPTLGADSDHAAQPGAAPSDVPAATSGAAAAQPGLSEPGASPGRASLSEAPSDLDGGDAPPAAVGQSTLPGPLAGAPELARPPAVAPASLFRLTEPGCCTQPTWAADSARVLFMDRPAGGTLGIWSESVSAPDSTPELVTEEIASYARNFTFKVEQGQTQTVLQRLEDGARFEIPSGGRPVSFSPSASQVAWQTATGGTGGQPGGNDGAPGQVWVAQADGTGARQVATIVGSLGGWMGEDALLLRGRESRDAIEDNLWRLDLARGERQLLARSERIRGESVSPNGRWVVYYVAGATDPAADGFFMVGPELEGPLRLRDTLFGAYRWRDGDRLLLVPQSVGGASHQLFQLTAPNSTAAPLTDPTTQPFKVAGGDWTVSPDGSALAFVSGEDKAIWVLGLPEPGTAPPPGDP